jgi:hypothetical protein
VAGSPLARPVTFNGEVAGATVVVPAVLVTVTA